MVKETSQFNEDFKISCNEKCSKDVFSWYIQYPKKLHIFLMIYRYYSTKWKMKILKIVFLFYLKKWICYAHNNSKARIQSRISFESSSVSYYIKVKSLVKTKNWHKKIDLRKVRKMTLKYFFSSWLIIQFLEKLWKM